MTGLVRWARKEWGHLTHVALYGAALVSSLIAAAKYPIVSLFGLWFPKATAEALAIGVANTIWISLASIAFGTALGIVIAYLFRPLARSRSRLLSKLMAAILYCALAVPVYVILIFSTPHFRSAEVAAIWALSVNLSVFIARLILGAFESLPRAQMEAAHALGVGKSAYYWRFERPAVWRICARGVTNEWATTIKLSSLVGIIGVFDVMKAALNHIQETYSLAAFVVVVGVYVALTFPLFWVSDHLGKRGSK